MRQVAVSNERCSHRMEQCVFLLHGERSPPALHLSREFLDPPCRVLTDPFLLEAEPKEAMEVRQVVVEGRCARRTTRGLPFLCIRGNDRRGLSLLEVAVDGV